MQHENLGQNFGLVKCPQLECDAPPFAEWELREAGRRFEAPGLVEDYLRGQVAIARSRAWPLRPRTAAPGARARGTADRGRRGVRQHASARVSTRPHASPRNANVAFERAALA
jgi:hypothetical protein